MAREMNVGEAMLAGYAKQHGYSARFEPDWEARFGREFTKDPDFLMGRGEAEAIVEVRDFNARPLEQHFGPRFSGSVDPAILRRPLYRGIAEKAEQLADFADVGLPLVIALTSTGTGQIDLGPHELQSTLFGEVGISMPLDPVAGELDAGAAQHVSEAGYGVFRGTDEAGAEINRWQHVSGVAVLARFDLYTEFQEDDLRRYVDSRSPTGRVERGTLAAEWMQTPVGRREAPGPLGFDYAVTYYDLAGYALGSGAAVPAEWFDGERDQRLGFDSTGRVFGLDQSTPA